MGLRYVMIDENMKDKMKLGIDYGALVLGQGPQHEGVVSDSPAHKAGIKDKDIIMECNGEKITVEKTIQDFLENMEVGDTMRLKLLRSGKPMEVRVTLAERK